MISGFWFVGSRALRGRRQYRDYNRGICVEELPAPVVELERREPRVSEFGFMVKCFTDWDSKKNGTDCIMISKPEKFAFEASPLA